MLSHLSFYAAFAQKKKKINSGKLNKELQSLKHIARVEIHLSSTNRSRSNSR
jgi:hypothetical protein